MRFGKGNIVSHFYLLTACWGEEIENWTDGIFTLKYIYYVLITLSLHAHLCNWTNLHIAQVLKPSQISHFQASSFVYVHLVMQPDSRLLSCLGITQLDSKLWPCDMFLTVAYFTDQTLTDWKSAHNVLPLKGSEEASVSQRSVCISTAEIRSKEIFSHMF